MGKKLSFEDFIKRAIKIHGYNYDYSKSEYVNTTTKIKIRCKEHDIWFYQSPELQEKAKKTCFNNFGVECPFQSQEIQEKIKRTNLKRYGVKNPIQKNISNDNPQIYIKLGYKTQKLHSPELYFDDIWDCGKMILNRE